MIKLRLNKQTNKSSIGKIRSKQFKYLDYRGICLIFIPHLIIGIILLSNNTLAEQVPQGISGKVFDEFGKEAPSGTFISVYDTVSGQYIEGQTGHGSPGSYSATLHGKEGSLIIIKVWNEWYSSSRNVTINGIMRNLNIILNTIPSNQIQNLSKSSSDNLPSLEDITKIGENMIGFKEEHELSNDRDDYPLNKKESFDLIGEPSITKLNKPPTVLAGIIFEDKEKRQLISAGKKISIRNDNTGKVIEAETGLKDTNNMKRKLDGAFYFITDWNEGDNVTINIEGIENKSLGFTIKGSLNYVEMEAADKESKMNGYPLLILSLSILIGGLFIVKILGKRGAN